MSLSAFMAFIAVVYVVFQKMRLGLHQGLNKLHFFTTVGSILILALGLFLSGFFTQSNSSDTQAVLFDYTLLKKFISLAGFLLLFAQVVFVFNCLFSLLSRRRL
jgi:heme/copper-type cytochrome/quinol oxidase subunit 1